MQVRELQQKMYIKAPILSITRLNYDGEATDLQRGCSLRDSLNKALEGETVYVTAESNSCYGGVVGFGFEDGLPNTPGGFGHFLSHGRGEGFPAGEKVKCDILTAEAMINNQPQDVMGRFNTIRIKPYEPEDNADTVTFLANPDNLSALIHLFNFRNSAYDNVFAPMTSGCSSIFRIPLGEMIADSNRAVIGNVDIVSRLFFDASTFFFTVSNKNFKQMLEDADDCFLNAPYWRGVEKRLKEN